MVLNAASTLSTAAIPDVRSSESDVGERVLKRVCSPIPLKYLTLALLSRHRESSARGS